MKNNALYTVLKGIIIGGTMLVPGISGGSMAMILGIYDKLISSVSSFQKNKKDCFLFLFLFCIGTGLGIFLFSSPLSLLIEQYPMPMLYFFLGVVTGSIPFIFKQVNTKIHLQKALLYIMIGLLIVSLFSMIPKEAIFNEITSCFTGFLMLIAVGIIAAVALILPGISISYLLLLFGLYDKTMQAIHEFDFLFLLPLVIGLFLGILLTTKILERAMTRHRQITYFMILGFMLGSIVEVFPGLKDGASVKIAE